MAILITSPDTPSAALRHATPRWRLHLAAAGLALAVSGFPASTGAATPEYAVKAAYLFKFAPFVDWPASAFASPSGPFEFCILGRDPFGSILGQAISGQHVGEHPAVVRRLTRVDASSGCHILYLGSSPSQTASDALRVVRGAPILTVADDNREAGAIIKFVIKDNRVRFDIDAAAAAVNHVAISSKLLGLATSVTAGTP